MSRPTKEEYEASWRAKGFIKLDNGEWVKRANNTPRNQLPIGQPKQKREDKQVCKTKEKVRIVACPGTRIRLCFMFYSVQLVDEDNLSCRAKDITDGLRHSGMLPQDSPGLVKIECDQEKVNHYKDQKTVVEIIYP